MGRLALEKDRIAFFKKVERRDHRIVCHANLDHHIVGYGLRTSPQAALYHHYHPGHHALKRAMYDLHHLSVQKGRAEKHRQFKRELKFGKAAAVLKKKEEKMAKGAAKAKANYKNRAHHMSKKQLNERKKKSTAKMAERKKFHDAKRKAAEARGETPKPRKSVKKPLEKKDVQFSHVPHKVKHVVEKKLSKPGAFPEKELAAAKQNKKGLKKRRNAFYFKKRHAGFTLRQRERKAKGEPLNPGKKWRKERGKLSQAELRKLRRELQQRNATLPQF
eukprot:TRINITY_DN10371_c0_g2_i1.p1 TRINITY_DN10371_c0_g2~~TRINITY_DN10371_c0_g2_i1.p1  ORF type:complete len:275 (+),score=78.43 TRINITY_DN10371_c0_g2_i1:2-826(+)